MRGGDSGDEARGAVHRFSPVTRAALVEQGWRLGQVPGGLTLSSVRAAGAPFKGDKFFREQAAQAREVLFPASEVAYRPGLMPGSVSRPYGDLGALVTHLERLLPTGAVATVGSAATYAWLLTEHHRTAGEWLLSQCFTWCADEYGPSERGIHLVVGVMGQSRPIMVSPLPEGTGRGVGLLPLVVPAVPGVSAA